MRSSWSNRLLRACLALWLVLSGGEAGLVHACPMHGGVPAHPAAASAPQAAGHAGHAAHAAAMATHEHGGHDAGHCCTCVGACHASGTLASVPAAPTVRVAALVRTAPTTSLDVDSVADVRTAHARPFANGPPARILTA